MLIVECCLKARKAVQWRVDCPFHNTLFQTSTVPSQKLQLFKHHLNRWREILWLLLGQTTSQLIYPGISFKFWVLPTFMMMDTLFKQVTVHSE